MRAASSWEACPRCLARDQVTVPLTFELGWRGGQRDAAPPKGDEPLKMKRLPLDRDPVEEPAAEVDAA